MILKAILYRERDRCRNEVYHHEIHEVFGKVMHTPQIAKTFEDLLFLPVLQKISLQFSANVHFLQHAFEI